MPDPVDRDEYERLFLANSVVGGYGTEVHQTIACPFCAAPGFATWYIAELATTDYAAMRDEHTCSACGRSGKMIITHPLDGGVQSEFVQTGGPDPAPWLQPHPRRVER